MTKTDFTQTRSGKSVRRLTKYLSYILLLIGVALAFLWIIQQVSSLDLIGEPQTISLIFLLVGFVIRAFVHRRR